MDTIFPRAISPKQAAPILGLSDCEVIELRRSGELPGVLRLEDDPLAIPVAAVGAMIAAQERNACEIGVDHGRDLAAMQA